MSARKQIEKTQFYMNLRRDDKIPLLRLVRLSHFSGFSLSINKIVAVPIYSSKKFVKPVPAFLVVYSGVLIGNFIIFSIVRI
mgnify:CR=1 FL=1